MVYGNKIKPERYKGNKIDFEYSNGMVIANLHKTGEEIGSGDTKKVAFETAKETIKELRKTGLL